MSTNRGPSSAPVRIPPPCGKDDSAYFQRFYAALAAGEDAVVEGWNIQRFVALGGAFAWGTFSHGLAQAPSSPASQSAITACVLCRNCRSRLAPCIASARTLANTVVIVDSGSADGTWEDALQLADTAVRVLGPINFGHLRTVALRQVQTEWSFMLDTDEAIPTGGAELLRRVITWADEASVDVIWQARNWLVPPSLSPFCAYRGHPFLWPDPQARLVRMSAGPTYRGIIHERLEAQAGRYACLVGSDACSLLHLKHWITSDFERQQLLHERQSLQPDGPDTVQLAPSTHGAYLVELSGKLLLPVTRDWLSRECAQETKER
jgi:hypothetical protein